MPTGFRARQSPHRPKNFYYDSLRGTSVVRNIRMPIVDKVNWDNNDLPTARQITSNYGVTENRLKQWVAAGIVRRKRDHGHWGYDRLDLAKAIKRYGVRSYEKRTR